MTTAWRQFEGRSSFGPVPDADAALSTDPSSSGVDHPQSLALLAQQTEILELLAAGASLHRRADRGGALAGESHARDAMLGAALRPASATGSSTPRRRACPPRTTRRSTVSCAARRPAPAARPRTWRCPWSPGTSAPTRGGRATATSRPRTASSPAGRAPSSAARARCSGRSRSTTACRTRPSRREAKLVERYRHLAAIAINHSRLWGALAESEEKFRRAFEDNAVGMALLDLDGHFFLVNKAMCDLLGAGEDDLLGLHYRDITHPDDVDPERCGAGRARRRPRREPAAGEALPARGRHDRLGRHDRVGGAQPARCAPAHQHEHPRSDGP